MDGQFLLKQWSIFNRFFAAIFMIRLSFFEKALEFDEIEIRQ
jgi:hypothetical protein